MCWQPTTPTLTYSLLLALIIRVLSMQHHNNSIQQALKFRNPNNPNTATDAYGVFYLPGPNDVIVKRLSGEEVLGKRAAGHAAADAARAANKTEEEAKADSVAAYTAWAKGNIKLTVTGFMNSKPTGTVEFFLAAMPNVDPAHPAYNFVMDNWNKIDLRSLNAGKQTRVQCKPLPIQTCPHTFVWMD